MAHIQLPEGAPGIVGPMLAYPATEKHLNGLAEALLRGPSSLTPEEREVIATYVSCGNECYFCTNVHAAAARYLGKQGEQQTPIIDSVIQGMERLPPARMEVDDKLRALLNIADKVRRDGRLVNAEDVAETRAHGADDQAIHDTVLIAAAFCMFNRYVDGLATFAPKDPAVYDASGERLGTNGYERSIR